MFARFQTVSSLPSTPEHGDPDRSRRELTDVLRRHAGYSGAYFLVSGPTAMRALVTLWATEDDARAASDRTRAATGDVPRPAVVEDTVYEVIDDEPGAAAGAEPTVVAVAAFDGPMSDAARAATDRTHRRRIIPALQAVPGTVRLMILWDHLSRTMRALLFTTEPATVDAGLAAIDASAPDADEDPALVTPPDRLDRYAVAGADLPVGR